MALAVVVELLVDAVGHPQQGQLAQGGEVAGPEVVAQGGVDALRRVDVAVGQAATEGLGGHVDQLDLVGGPDHPVGHRLLLGHAGDPLDHVVERLEVLEVDCRDDIDAGVEQVVDVLPALGVPRSRDVGVGQLVDQDQLGLAGQQPLEVHLLEGLAPVLDSPAGEDRQVPDLGVGLGTSVVLHPADHHVGAALPASPALVEHGVGLADTGCGPKVEAELAAGHVVLPVGSVAQHHCAPSSSKAMFMVSTSTPGSPGTPRLRPTVFSVVSLCAAGNGRCRDHFIVPAWMSTVHPTQSTGVTWLHSHGSFRE